MNCPVRLSPCIGASHPAPGPDCATTISAAKSCSIALNFLAGQICNRRVLYNGGLRNLNLKKKTPHHGSRSNQPHCQQPCRLVRPRDPVAEGSLTSKAKEPLARKSRNWPKNRA